MMMTEEEALEKGCPYQFKRGSKSKVQKSGNFNAPGGYDFPSPDSLGRCIASQCMAWRWVVDRPIDQPTVSDLEALIDEPDGHVEIKPDGSVVSRTRGYCGLAGKPE